MPKPPNESKIPLQRVVWSPNLRMYISVELLYFQERNTGNCRPFAHSTLLRPPEKSVKPDSFTIGEDHPHNSKYGLKVTGVSNKSPCLLRKATCPHLQYHHVHWCSLPWQTHMNITLSCTGTLSSNCSVSKALVNPHQTTHEWYKHVLTIKICCCFLFYSHVHPFSSILIAVFQVFLSSWPSLKQHGLEPLSGLVQKIYPL